MRYYALGYAFVAIVCAVLLLAFRRGLRATAQAAAAGLAGLTVFGGYWYIRNWLVTGSPLFPLGGTMASDDAPFYPALWQSTFLGNGSPELFDLSLTAIWDMTGPVHWAAFVAPARGARLAAHIGFFLLWDGSPDPSIPAKPSESDGSGDPSYVKTMDGQRDTSTAAVENSTPMGSLATRSWSGTRAILALATVAALAVLIVTPFAVEDDPGTLNQMHWKYCPVRYGLCLLSLVALCEILLTWPRRSQHFAPSARC